MNGERFALLSLQANYAMQEMAHLDRILEGAVSTLIDNFSGLAADLAARSGGSIDARIEATLRALQFHDLTSQLIVHLRERLAHIENLCSLADEHLRDTGVKGLHSVAARSTPASLGTRAEASSVDLF